MNKKSFTLIELMIIIGIISIITTTILTILKPSEILKNLRDTRRINDLKNIEKYILLLESEHKYGILPFYGTSSIVYISLPDNSPTCSSWINQLPSLPSGYQYNCVATPTNIDSTGWIPINFSQSSLLNIQKLPIDPINRPPYYYTYVSGGSYELTAALESDKSRGVNNIGGKDGGFDNYVYEIGTDKKLTPLPVISRLQPLQGLIGWWPLDEGIGTIAYDYSGYNNTGTIYASNAFYLTYCDDLNGFSSNMTLTTSSYLSWLVNGYSVSASTSLASSGTDYYIKYDQPGTWDFTGYNIIRFYFRSNVASSSFNYSRLYICDNNNNCGYYNLSFSANSDLDYQMKSLTLGSYNGNNGSNPNTSTIDYINFVFNPNTDISNLNIKIDVIFLTKSSGTPIFEDCKVNKCLYFGGWHAGTRIIIPDRDIFRITDAVSISAWIRMDWYGHHDSSQDVLCKSPGGSGYDYSYSLAPYFKNKVVSFCITDGTKSECASQSNFYNINQYPTEWVHLVGVTSKSLGKVLLYKNGVLVSSTPRTIDNIYINNYNICIGCHYRYYHGWIDDVRLYNRALTPEEVKTLYEATR